MFGSRLQAISCNFYLELEYALLFMLKYLQKYIYVFEMCKITYIDC